MVENVEKVFLGFLLTCEKLNIIYQKHIDHLVEVHKVVDGAFADSLNELGDEALGGDIQDCPPRSIGFDFVADSLQEVGFPKPYATVNEKRVVGCHPGPVGHGIAC